MAADCRSKPGDRGQQAYEVEIALMTRESDVTKAYWKEKAKEAMDSHGWGDDDESIDSVPPLIPREEVYSSEEEEDDEEGWYNCATGFERTDLIVAHDQSDDLPDWIRDNRLDRSESEESLEAMVDRFNARKSFEKNMGNETMLRSVNETMDLTEKVTKDEEVKIKSDMNQDGIQIFE